MAQSNTNKNNSLTVDDSLDADLFLFDDGSVTSDVIDHDNTNNALVPVSSTHPHPSPLLTSDRTLHNNDASTHPVDATHRAELHDESQVPDYHNPIEEDTLSSDDRPFSQEVENNSNDTCSRSSSESAGSEGEEDLDSEIIDLNSRNNTEYIPLSNNHLDGTKAVIQDHFSSLFTDEVGEYVNMKENTESDEDEVISSSLAPTNTEREPELSRDDCSRGLRDWKYSSVYENVSLCVDSVDRKLCPLFVKEANYILRNVVTHTNITLQKAVDNTSLTRLNALDAFLPISILEKLRLHINAVLIARRRQPRTVIELKGTIVLHVLAASYGTCVATITARENREFFFQVGITGGRYKEVWSALSCTKGHRQAVEHGDLRWLNKPTTGNSLITEMESDLAAINRTLVNIEGVTIYSVDDDHNRISSRAVILLTNMSQVNNPSKALGPVNNAVCSALTHAFIASHYSRPGEKTVHVWHRLVQLLQGVPTVGALRPMVDSLFAADRGYNEVETILFLNETLGATSIGTHKRSLSFPFVFGDGPI